MNWQEMGEYSRIEKLAAQPVRDGECVLTWQWPKDIQAVYVYSFEAGAEKPPELLAPQQMKLFTREEYKAKSGYRERIDYIGSRGYRIFPCMIKDGAVTALLQKDEHNVVRVNGGKAGIRYSVHYGRKLFGKFKTARIQLFCEIPVPQEALCYVKKEGAPPSGRQDGTAYPFRRDFDAGSQSLPEIEIGRNDYLRLFLTDPSRYGEIFELIQE
ncbi:hypothetical protein [Paenibacillus lutrae]|uniref:Beta-mannanase n=1 Tax=Paenibacillus lutrae TaxID=2078573 RepID=A0A7X3JY92_9BACL|nr:hypothetical protein [Paenibacillus lutrae]MVO98821.1 hypothetical protein [Paenibacillus lutrae]